MEKFFWADQIAEDIIKKHKGKKVYVCSSGITPSGNIHIGNFREVITTDLVVKALKNKKKNVKFLYSWDDYDRFRKVPTNIPKDYERYIGMPLSEILSPFEKNKSYAEHFEEEFEKSVKKLNIDLKFTRQWTMNKKCKYSSLIKKAIDKREEIMEILNKYRKDPLNENWMPFEIYCGKCKKDSATVLDVKGYFIEYECKCGFKEKFDFRKKGIVKLKWRIDWPARWKYEEVVYEPGGIDHSAPGGSFTTAQEISKQIFNYEPPIYTFYDWVRPKGGTEFSSSSGNALTVDDVLEIYEPEILRYLFVSTRPNKGFQISFDNDVIKIYEDFDELERKYFEHEANAQEKRIYELSVVKIPKKKPNRINFRHLITSVQVGKAKGLDKLNKNRSEKVGNWLEKYAGEDMKFEFQERVNIALTEKEKEALTLLKSFLKKKNLNEDQLFNEFYSICEGTELSGKEFFKIAYEVIIGKTKGPRLASLILAIGKEKVIKLLNQIK